MSNGRINTTIGIFSVVVTRSYCTIVSILGLVVCVYVCAPEREREVRACVYVCVCVCGVSALLALPHSCQQRSVLCGQLKVLLLIRKQFRSHFQLCVIDR
jgi:predicted membrane channel-forming protein YqfA (hemolysin III family)